MGNSFGDMGLMSSEADGGRPTIALIPAVAEQLGACDPHAHRKSGAKTSGRTTNPIYL